MKRIIGCLLVAALLVCGCSAFGPKEEKTADQLAEEGRQEFSDGDYKSAIEAYQKLRGWYPFSKFAKEAELKVADAHYRLEEYEQAIAAYEQFERLHPNDEKIPYVIYQIGRCYFDRMRGIDRDQTYTEKALQEFQRLQNRFPESQYAEKAGKHIRRCLKTLAGHEFYVGEFYFKQKHYKAALNRFLTVVNNYPSEFTLLHHKANKYIERCRNELEDAPAEKSEATSPVTAPPRKHSPVPSPPISR
ncbi:MAG: outer membrane protein assembly factor BamD [Desulfobacterales bacterium]